MRAAAIDRFGPPKVLTLHDLPTPKCGAQEVLIAIDAAGVGMWDARTRAGKWAEGDEKFPRILTTFDLDDAADAHRRVEKGHLLGKIVLRVGARTSRSAVVRPPVGRLRAR